MGKPDIYVYDATITVQRCERCPGNGRFRRNIGLPEIYEGTIFPNEVPKFFERFGKEILASGGADAGQEPEAMVHVHVETYPCSANGKRITRSPLTADEFMTKNSETNEWSSQPKTMTLKF